MFCRTGLAGVTAVFPTAATEQNGFIVPPGAIVTYSKNQEDTHIACILASGTANAYIKSGEGE
jgi:hypothetical protein